VAAAEGLAQGGGGHGGGESTSFLKKRSKKLLRISVWLLRQARHMGHIPLAHCFRKFHLFS
jgi:hypothetical protein